MKRLKETREIQVKLKTILPKIAQELTPNGGSSLRDTIDRIDKNVKILDSRQKVMMVSTGKAWFEADIHGKYTYVCRNWTELTGLSLVEARGNGWVLGVHPDDRVKVFEEWEQAVEQDREFLMNYRYVDRKGHSTMCEVHGYPYRDGDVTSGYVGVISVLDSEVKLGIV
jgi:PAS domain S-box-containing protein